MMPVPTHLIGIAVPRDPTANEESLSADVRCPCGESVFQLLYPGHNHEHEGEIIPCTAEVEGRYFFVLRALCTGCSAEHLLFDKDFHGWDGFICHDPVQAALPRPELVTWSCQGCTGSQHTLVVHILTEGREDFISEAGEDYEAERWPDAFGWFSLDLTCTACGKSSPELVSYETM